jgi:hypothetical protein
MWRHQHVSGDELRSVHELHHRIVLLPSVPRHVSDHDLRGSRVLCRNLRLPCSNRESSSTRLAAVPGLAAVPWTAAGRADAVHARPQSRVVTQESLVNAKELRVCT